MIFAIVDDPATLERLKELEGQLTPMQKAFAVNVLRGINLSEAYKRSRKGRVTEGTAWVEGSNLRRNPKVAEFIAAVREAVGKYGLLDYFDKLAYLEGVLAIGANQLMDDDGSVRPETQHFIQKLTMRYDKTGKVVQRTVEMMAKGQAMLLHNALSGHTGPPRSASEGAEDAIQLEKVAARILPSLDLPGPGSAEHIELEVVHEKV